MYYFYVLQSLKKSDWFYKGSTSNLRKRINQHNAGETKSSAPYKPFRLVYYEAYYSEAVARQRESSVKKSGSVWKPLMVRIKRSIEKTS